MSVSTTAVSPALTLASRAADWIELCKPRISVMVLVAVAMAAFLARWGDVDFVVLAHTLSGVALVAASASAINQLLEIETDALMERTRRRPLPSGRLSVAAVRRFALIAIVVGLGQFLWFVNVTAAAWAFATWLIYGWIYTPLKRRSAFNTVVGAVSGATPILIGWTAMGVPLDMRALALTMILFLWQFPHFMAIAWLYRQQYADVGIRMLTVVDPTGTRAAIQAVAAALALLPVSFVPALYVAAPGASLFVVLAFLLGVGQLIFAILFFAVRSRSTAAWLLKASLIYLPLLLVLLMLLPWF
jgi:protoheme IX farnesyltransferase